MTDRTRELRAAIVARVEDHPFDIAQSIASRFGMSRQAVQRHLAALELAGELRSEREGRRRRWSKATHLFRWQIEGLDESSAYFEHIDPLLSGASDAARSIVLYGFTEMVNNAIDHSDASFVDVQLSIRGGSIEVWVGDDGVGAFRRIATHFGLPDDRAAVLDLAKGRVTTFPERHSGQGIFFTSRAMDKFVIYSKGLCLQRIREHVQTMAREMPEGQKREGTLVFMTIATDATRTMKEVFDEFSDPDIEGFTRTRLAVKLCAYDGKSVVSRSQGKRLMSRVDAFERVSLDFQGLDEIGQGFADEVFRVWMAQFPNVEVVVRNASEDVMRMIRRTRNTAGLPPIAAET